jgi:hypothetical protein
LYQLWLESQRRILPVTIHRDEAMAECLAAKQPLGEYRQDSLAAEEILTWPTGVCCTIPARGAMIRLSTLLLAPPVGTAERTLCDYRQHGASWLSASLGCLWASLVWALMPLETPRWQAILNVHHDYFPHINPHRPRPLDPLRYLLQSLWLLATRVPEPDKGNWRSLAALEGVTALYPVAGKAAER